MYFILKENYILRGWEDEPYVLCNIADASFRLLNKVEYRALSFCNGFIYSENILITSDLRNLIDKFVSENIVSISKNKGEITDFQKYRHYPSRLVKSAHWSITGRCNYKCRHCLISAPHSKLGELSLENCYKIIDDLHDCGVIFLSITGGEPLIRNDFFNIIDRALEKNIIISNLYSNGKLITPDFLDKLEQRGIKPEISISFDGIGWHDWLRGEKKAEEYAINAFKLCSSRNFITTSEMCIHKLNRHSIRETVNLLASLNVKHLKICSIMQGGEWISENEDYSLSCEELYDTFLDYIKYYYEDNMPISLNLGGFFSAKKGSSDYTIPIMKDDKNTDKEKYLLCGHVKGNIYIGADGKILPCMPLANSQLSTKFPDIVSTKLLHTLSDPFYNEIISLTLGEFLEKNKRCSQCEYKFVCMGGCRGMAIESDKDDYFLADKEACFFFKNGYKQKIENLISQLT